MSKPMPHQVAYVFARIIHTIITGHMEIHIWFLQPRQRQRLITDSCLHAAELPDSCRLPMQALVNKGSHPAYADTAERFPLANAAVAQRLTAVLSQLAHWCPVFGAWGEG